MAALEADQRPDRMAPHSIEAEEAVLGSILINPDSLYEAAAFLMPNDFFIVRHAWVYEAILDLRRRGEAIDYLTVANALRCANRLDEIGGAAALTRLINHAPSSIYTEAYSRIVQRAAIRRRLLSAASEIAQLAHEEDKDIHEVVNAAEKSLLDVTNAHVADDVQKISVVASAVFEQVGETWQHKTPGIPTGLIDVDRIIGGLQKSDLIIVAGRPGMGKTSWLLSVMLNVAQSGYKSLIFSQEMTNAQLTGRLIAMLSGVSTDQQRKGRMTDAEFCAFTAGMGKVAELPIWLSDTANLTPMQLLAKARRQMDRGGLDLIVVDYLGLLRSGLKVQNQTQEITEISRSLKQIARELNVPVLVAAQLNRAVENRADKRPMLADLRDSGSIEQDADIVLFLYRDELYNANTERPNRAELIVAKHRNGPTGSAALFFRKELTQFTNLAVTELNDQVYRG